MGFSFCCDKASKGSINTADNFHILNIKKRKIVNRIKKKRLKPLKNINSVARAQFLRMFAWLFCPLCVLGFWMSGITGVIVAFIASLVISPLILFILDRYSRSAASLLYGGGQGTWSQREQLQGDLNTVKHHKMRKEYDQALKAVNSILKVDPDFSEALFLKAQILWEGFENLAAAKGYLKRIKKLKKNKDDAIHRWASALYDELTEIEKESRSSSSKPSMQ